MIFSRKNNKEITSKEYDALISKIADLRGDMELYKAKLDAYESKFLDFKIQVGKLRREANKIKEDEPEETTKYNNPLENIRHNIGL